MESSSSSLSFCSTLSKTLLVSTSKLDRVKTAISWRRRSKKSSLLQISVSSYQKFIDFAINETKDHFGLVPSPLQERFGSINADDGKSKLRMLSFEAPKIRLVRSMNIESESIQVLDFAAFAKPEFDVPIFCANFFTSPSISIVVLDLNPLHDVVGEREYKDKYYKNLIPLHLKYLELLPWGGKLTAESIKFFSPIVIWTKFSSDEYKHEVLYSAFVEYYQAWLGLMDVAAKETKESRIMSNREAQHRYLTWRAQKDPGHGLLQRLIGATNAKDLLRNFLFNGIDELGTKNFLDYFPEYFCEDGTINEKRSMVGKLFADRPWNSKGEFIGNIIQK